ncbi:DgyrCDS7634 [Dimorphilus gyrociliatus]|uniref:DgyrCDS7634 n=1 Tax=Dimorphilus gyrociliatus TaxID=2664684 RepID=A0A7I8VWJ8_9ANNE|nr:DgyrCDS7634 [Dimorphilus gyrociliatus]
MTPLWVIFACFCVYSVENAAVPTKTCTAIQNCDDCSNPALTCTRCPAGYTIKSDGQKCLPCPDNCLSCNNTEAEKTVCLECKPSYWLKSSDKVCEKCPNNCATCKEKGTSGTAECITCFFSHGLKNDKTGCVPCSAMTGCTVCKDSNDDNVADICEACSSNQGLKGDKKGCVGKILSIFLMQFQKIYMLFIPFVACPSNCQVCTDADNDGKAECSSCSNLFGLKPDKTGCASCSALGSECLTCTIGNDQTTPSSCDSCTGGYVVRGNKQGCSKCPDGCKIDKCSDSQGTGTAICEECKDTWGVKISKAGCVRCNANCNKCTVEADETTTKCTECVARYEKTNMNTCDFCPENCLSCEISNGKVVCKSSGCKQKYAWKSDDGSCVKCPVNCNECSYSGGISKCRSGKCISGYTDRVSDGKCYQCPDRCSKCSDDGTKTKCGWQYCQIGSAWKGDDGSCPECPSGCKYCYADREYLIKCSICHEKKTLTSDRAGCTDCPINCNECELVDNVAKCLDQQCYDGYYRDDNGQCKACSTGCKSCIKSGSTTECLVCKAYYVMNPTTKKCVSCPGGCETGKCQFSSTKSVCSKCLKGFVLSDGSCRGCPSNCDTCKYEGGKTICTTCSAKHYHVQTQMCIACPPGCKSCTESGTTVICNTNQCLSGYEYYNNKCYKCPSKCTSCTGIWSASVFKTVCDTNKCSGAFATDSNGLCQPCSENCESCTSPGKCSKCNTGYILAGSACEACATNCADCSQPGKCSTCLPGYKLDSDECKECAAKDQCETCNDQGAGRCDYCKLGYVVKDNSQACLQCPAGCNYCEQKSPTSDDPWCKPGGCKIGFAQKRNRDCTECPPGCAECTYDATETNLLCRAGKCKQGYTESSGVCVRCADNCITCNAQGKCNEKGCKSGYTRSSNGQQCDKCANNCFKCDIKGAAKCDEDGCNTGFAYDNEICQPCQPTVCSRCSKKDKCDNGGCIGNYILKDEICQKCDDNCKTARCTQNGPGKCDVGECKDHYVLDSNNECKRCDNNCEDNQCGGFTVGGKCNELKCKLHYTWESDSCHQCDTNCYFCDGWGKTKCDVDRCFEGYRIKLDSSVHTCETCSVTNCAKCDADRTQCQKCKKGYTLNSNTCDKCSDNCDYCDVDGKDTCDQGWCSSGYGWNPDTRLCAQCANSCTKCSKYGHNKCDSAAHCPADKGYDSTNHDCLTCDSNCNPGKCTEAGKCSADQCQSGFKLKGDNTCEACADTCKTCKEANDATKCLSCKAANQFVTDLVGGSSCIQCASNCKVGQCFAAGKCNKDQCMDGYMLATDYTCTECGSNCKTCSAVGKCTSCMGNRFLSGDQCLTCDPNCKPGKCSAENKCDSQQCMNNYKFKADDQTCEKCHDECATCAAASDASKCLTCTATRSSDNVAGGTCVVCDPNCKAEKCTTAGQCSECSDGYALDGNVCKPCHADCTTCAQHNDAAQCKSCNDPMKGIKDGAGTGECIACDVNCKLGQCTTAGQCKADECKDGYALDGNFCKPCHPDCATCKAHNDKDKCLTCASPNKGSEDASNGGACVVCDPNCQPGECTVANQCNTDKCIDGYASEGTGCTKCHVSCKTCKAHTVDNKCLSCMDITKGVKDTALGGQCIACHANCKLGKCDTAGQCDNGECKDGYASDGTSCAACHPSCATCTTANDANACKTCVSATGSTDAATGGSCVVCDPNCQPGQCNEAGKCNAGKCKDGYALDSNVCKPCHADCTTCAQHNDAAQCNSCVDLTKGIKDGAATGECIACDVNCKLGQCTTAGQCSDGKCKDGYASDGTACKPCHPDCATCSVHGNAAKCLTCVSPSKGSADAGAGGACVVCHENCQSGQCIEVGKCNVDKCTAGYIYKTADKTCEACHGDCLTCTVADDNTKCLSCIYPKATTNPIDGGSCISCDSNCKEGECTAAGKCNKDKCKDNYMWQSDGTCAQCASDCKTCSVKADASKCLTCVDLSKTSTNSVDGGSCVACHDSCKSGKCSSTGKCYGDLCSVGFFLKSDGTCQACDQTCSTCFGSTLSDCITCKGDRFSSGGKCIKCHEECMTNECTEDGSCKKNKCKDGFTNNVRTGNTVSELQCSKACVSNCRRCDNAGENKCDKGMCKDGYVWVNSGECAACSSNCMSCYTNGKDKCDTGKCMSGYTYDSSDKTCKACGSNCLKCDKTGAGACDYDQCVNNMIYDKASQTCKSCDVNCQPYQCYNSGRLDSKCNDDKCKTNLKIDSTTKTCKPCHANCKAGQCTEPDTCTNGQCMDRYVSDGNKCSACSSNCKKCETKGKGKCDEGECDVGFVWVSDSCKKTMCNTGEAMNHLGTCLTCPTGCLKCRIKTNNVTTECIPGLCEQGYTYSNGICVACPSNCDTCFYSQGILKCSKSGCESRYGYKDETCGQCATGCEECSKSGSELACDSSKCLNAYAQVSSNTCLKCYRGCDTCTMNTQTNFLGCSSSSCSTSYTQLADKSCFLCPTNCNSCTYTEALSQTKCDSNKCDTGYVMNNLDKSCHKCPTGCHKCSYTTTPVCDILQCKDGYVQNPISKECKVCPSKCSACFFDEATADAKCYDKGCSINSYMSSGTCLSCNSNCHRCMNVLGTKQCFDQKCSDNYGLKFNDRLCYACPEGCKHCDIATDGTPTCNTCQSGYAMNTADKTCKICPENCNVCDYDAGITDTKCQSGQCKSGFAQKDDNRLGCVQCQTCTACTYNTENPSVPDCVDNTCPAKQQVQTVGKQCGKCPTNCAACDGDLKCTLCDSRYALQATDKQCIVCPADCHSCDSLGNGKTGCKSTGCNSGYVVTDEKLCKKCPDNCLECTYNADTKKSLCKSTRCASRYAITTDFQCMKCPDNCYECVVGAGGKTECNENKCDSRYGWRSSDKNCHKCPDNCATCPEANGVLICDKCVSEFTLSNAECGACPRHCLKCTEEASEGLKCKECEARYVLDDNKNCAACPSNCNKCNINNGEAKCESCDSGYTLNTALTCTVCPSNCQKCEYKNNKAECMICHNGYAINAQKGCSRCADVTQVLNCDTCTNADSTGKGKCLSCVNGYGLKDDAKECLPCSDLKDCLNCRDQALLCNKCSSGFTLTPDKLNCGINCFTCNRSADCANDPKKSSENSTLCVPALGQTCWMHRFEENKVIEHERGCFNSTDCGSRYKSEECQEANGKKECKKCCTTDKCNSQILPGTASHLTSNVLTILTVLLLGVVRAVFY